MFNNRQDDLMVVFEKNWKANHNNDVQQARKKEKEFNEKMFGNNEIKINNKPSTPEDRLNNLNSNINFAREGQRQNKVNNIMKKWQ